MGKITTIRTRYEKGLLNRRGDCAEEDARRGTHLQRENMGNEMTKLKSGNYE